MLELKPTGANAERCPPAGYVIERGDRFGQQRGVTVRVTGYEGGEPHGLGVLGECRKHGVALEHRLVRGPDARQLVEVVHHEHPIEASRLGGLGRGDDAAEDGVAGGAGIGEVRNLIAESSHVVYS